MSPPRRLRVSRANTSGRIVRHGVKSAPGPAHQPQPRNAQDAIEQRIAQPGGRTEVLRGCAHGTPQSSLALA